MVTVCAAGKRLCSSCGRAKASSTCPLCRHRLPVNSYTVINNKTDNAFIAEFLYLKLHKIITEKTFLMPAGLITDKHNGKQAISWSTTFCNDTIGEPNALLNVLAWYAIFYNAPEP